MRKLWPMFALLLAPSVGSGQTAATLERAVNSIRPEDIASHIGVIAHDSMLGRSTPSLELEATADYAAGQFRQIGLTAGGDDGTFFQRYPLVEIECSVTISLSDGTTWGRDTEVLTGGSCVPHVTSGPLLLVTGIGKLPEGASVEGSVVMYFIELDATKTDYTREGYQTYQAIRGRDPAAVILATGFGPRVWEHLRTRGETRRIRKGWVEAPAATRTMLVHDATVGDFLAGQGHDVASLRSAAGQDVAVYALPDLRVTVEGARRTVALSAPNVVAILEGRDPMLRGEYVVLSAHMDHIGVGRPVDGDNIYNGADDNASGTAAIMELAEALSMLSPRPKRSVVLLMTSGEEKGLWGSEYFTENPTIPLSRVVANINIDMVGRNWPDTIAVVGDQASDLRRILREVNAAHPELDMTAIDDPWPEESLDQRGDHFSFAARGVPSLMFTNGPHEDYHRPSDEADRIDAEKVSRVVELILYLALQIANETSLPT